MVGVAKLVIAPGCGPGGRGFESHHSPQKVEQVFTCSFFFVLQTQVEGQEDILLPLFFIYLFFIASTGLRLAIFHTGKKLAIAATAKLITNISMI